METIMQKLIASIFARGFVCLIVIMCLVAALTWYGVTVLLWFGYKINGGRARYLRFLKVKKLHIANLK